MTRKWAMVREGILAKKDIIRDGTKPGRPGAPSVKGSGEAEALRLELEEESCG